MTIDDFLDYFPDVVITDEQLAACRYLQTKGQSFLVDFGYENAAAKVWDLIDQNNNPDPFDYKETDLESYRRALGIVL